MQEVTIRKRLYCLIDELAGPLDVEARAAALSAIIMRAEMEETHGLD